MDEHTHAANGIMCGHVHNQERPLRLIEHGPKGEWDFMCGEADHDTQDAIDAAVVVCMGCAMSGLVLPSNVQNLPIGHLAEFDPKIDLWKIRPMNEEEIAEYYED
ncbi:MAG: hypothetical protein ABJJ69_20020 [Paracoccaceae bacterium]